MKKDMQHKLKKIETNSETKQEIISDPFGSYTGRALEPEETPVQDADDL